MTWAAMITGGCGTLLALCYPTVVDSLLTSGWRKARFFLKSLLEAPPHPENDLALTSSLISCLRAGISLDAALERVARDSVPGSANHARLRRILLGEPGTDFLSTFLCSALESGAPALAALSGMERALRCRRRLQLKARGITGQCRAQAEVLSWLPWVLAGAIVLVDFSWFTVAAKSSLAWAFWAAAIGASGAGRHWMRRVILLALSPKNEVERSEEELLPDFTMRVLGEVSQGRDIELSAENALRALGSDRFRELYLNASAPAPGISRLRVLLQRASLTGAPVREDLLAFLTDHQAEMESLWEERVQRLPIALLAPLFVCFFPSSLLVLGGLLLPLLRDSL